MKKRIARLLAAAAIAAGLAVPTLAVQPASAVGEECTRRGPVRVCVDVNFGRPGIVRGYVIADDGANFHSVNVALYQCSGSSASSCGSEPIAEDGDVGHIFRLFSTSDSYSSGHTYRAKGSWTDNLGDRYVNIWTLIQA